MREVRVGIVGLGVAIRQVLHCFFEVEGVRLAAVADVRPEALEQFRQRFGVEAFADLRAMCEHANVDAVWVATPNHLHAEHTIVAAEHGKHVICEKPMAVSLDEAHRMVEAVERKWAGLRTFAPDNRMKFGFEPGRDDFFWCVGQGGMGIQTAPAASLLCASLIRGDALPADLAGVRPDDFAVAR